MMVVVSLEGVTPLILASEHEPSEVVRLGPCESPVISKDTDFGDHAAIELAGAARATIAPTVARNANFDLICN
jgi:hypothetical protein